MLKAIFFTTMLLHFNEAWTQTQNVITLPTPDSVNWISIPTDSGTVHAAFIVPLGKPPFPAIIILHGTHGFAEEYVRLARGFAKRGFVGIAACWFAGRKGEGVRFITPIEFKDAPSLVDAAGAERFRISRAIIDSVISTVVTLPYVKKNQLALFGHSRGAGASLDYVLTNPGKVWALILNSCGYPPDVIKRAADLSASVLILHGTADNPDDGGSAFTDIALAQAFDAALRAVNKDVEATYFKSSGHNALFSKPSQFTETIEQVSTFLAGRLLK